MVGQNRLFIDKDAIIIVVLLLGLVTWVCLVLIGTILILVTEINEEIIINIMVGFGVCAVCGIIMCVGSKLEYLR